MEYTDLSLGFSTADAEDVQLEFDGSDLVLTCLDWQENRVRYSFRDVLAYRWGQDVEVEGLRDDQAYEILESPWLEREAALAAVDCREYGHYKLCFNGCGVLDVLSRKEDS